MLPQGFQDCRWSPEIRNEAVNRIHGKNLLAAGLFQHVVVDFVEERFQGDVHDDALAFFLIPLGLPYRLVRPAGRTQ